MLQLQIKKVDVLEICKILAKYPIKASITEKAITLKGEITEDILAQICSKYEVISVQNYETDDSFICKKGEQDELNSTDSEEQKDIYSDDSSFESVDYDLKYGQVYWCDFGDANGLGKAYLRPAIVIQNDLISKSKNDLIVIPCTTNLSHSGMASRLVLTFSEETLLDYDPLNIGTKQTQIQVDMLKTVSKTRLRSYIGQLIPEIVEEIQNRLNFVLGLKYKSEKRVEYRDFSLNQINLLSQVYINKILTVSNSVSSNEEKVKKILEIFRFDFKQNGVQYLLEAILIASKKANISFDILADEVSKNNGIAKWDVQRLIVARIKETLKVKKATMDFIRLVKVFMTKQEVQL